MKMKVKVTMMKIIIILRLLKNWKAKKCQLINKLRSHKNINQKNNNMENNRIFKKLLTMKILDKELKRKLFIVDLLLLNNWLRISKNKIIINKFQIMLHKMMKIIYKILKRMNSYNFLTLFKNNKYYLKIWQPKIYSKNNQKLIIKIKKS